MPVFIPAGAVDACGSTLETSFDSNSRQEVRVQHQISVPHTERTLKVEFQTSLSRELREFRIYHTVGYRTTRFWGLKNFNVLMFCSARQQSECTAQPSFGLKAVPVEGLLAVCASSVKTIYARYTAASFNKTKINQWDDISGNGRHSVEWQGTNFQMLNVTGNGMNRTVLSVYGDTTTGVKFAPGSLPATFTICSLSKYGTGSQQRILGLTDGNWVHGHWSGRAGVAYYEVWRTSYDNLVNPNTDWVVMCGQNAGGNIMLTNGRSVGTGSGGRGSGQLAIGYSYFEAPSNWFVSQIAVWDRALSLHEMQLVTAHFREGEWDRIDPATVDC